MGHLPLSERHERSNEPGTAHKREPAWMDALSPLFPAHYGTHRVAATLHFSEYRLRERGRSCGVSTPAECHSDRVASNPATHSLFLRCKRQPGLAPAVSHPWPAQLLWPCHGWFS